MAVTHKKKRKSVTIKSKKQTGFLLSSNSPLTKAQKDKLKRELKSGKVKVRK